MRAPRSHSVNHAYSTLLSPRAMLRRVFGGMAVFISLPVLALGAYLIRRQFDDPVGSHPAGLLLAAVLIATALILLSYVIYPGGTGERGADASEFAEDVRHERTIEVSPCSPVALQDQPSDLAAPAPHVDVVPNLSAQARGMAGK